MRGKELDKIPSLSADDLAGDDAIENGTSETLFCKTSALTTGLTFVKVLDRSLKSSNHIAKGGHRPRIAALFLHSFQGLRGNRAY